MSVDVLVAPDVQEADGSQLPAPAAGDSERARTEHKKGKWEKKQLRDATRPLDAWERYRALVDASDEAYELIDIANREARFALIVMGALNAVPLVLVSRAEVPAVLSPGEQYVMGGLALAYVVLVLTFILRAIDALTPGRFRPELSGWAAGDLDRPVGIRYYEDIVCRSAAEHWTAWQNVRLSQVNAELAMQVHSLARKNEAKHASLRRLYAGLRLMALSLAALGLLFAVFAWT